MYIVYKTVNLVNGRVYYGIHKTDDVFFGSEMYFDGYVGDAKELNEDLKRYGRRAFFVEGLESFWNREQAQRILDNILANGNPPGSYHTNARSESHKGLRNALGAVRTEEFKSNLAEKHSGEGNPFHGKEHTEETKSKLSEFRASMIWINDGNAERQIPKAEEIPAAWARGRLPRIRVKGRSISKSTSPDEESQGK